MTRYMNWMWSREESQNLHEIVNLSRSALLYFVPHFYGSMAYVSTSWFHFTTASRIIAAVLREREEH